MITRESGWHFAWADGACSNHETGLGSMGIGILIEDDKGACLLEAGMWMGTGTSNIAEYIAVVTIIFKSLELGLTKLKIFSDSEIVVKQFSGDFSVKSPRLIPLYRKIKELVKCFEAIEITHISRNSNHSCDRLAKNASKKDGNKQWIDWFEDQMSKDILYG